MTRTNTVAMLLGATALTLAFNPASAQQQQESGRAGACEQLFQLVRQSEQAGQDLLQEFQQAPQVAEQNEAEACVLMIEKVESAGGITSAAQDPGQSDGTSTDTETFRATDTVRQTVEIEQEAVVEGQVTVRQAIPEIGIEQGTPEIEVSEAPVDVNIQEEPAEIMIRQAPANVRVQIPQPTITIEQPAPEIVVTMPPPGVSLQRQQPKVAVNIPDPTVTVSQADPEVSADVQARFVSGDEAEQLRQQGQQPQITTQTERLNTAGEPADPAKKAEVTYRKSDARVAVQPASDQSKVRVQAADPRVVFEPAEPNVEVTFAENADVQVKQIGEPTVRIERQGEQQASAQEEQGQQKAAMQQQEQQPQPEQQAAAQQHQAAEGDKPAADREAARTTPGNAAQLLGMQDGTELAQGDLIQVTAADLEGRNVVTLRGEDVGEIEGIFQNDGRRYAILSHGGFLGIGDDEIAIPIERIAIQGDDVVLLGLTEEQLEQMPEYDFETDQEVAGTEAVEIGRNE